jgi:hypothetical protein
MLNRILWSSDHHTLHQTTPTSHILGNYDDFLFKYNDLAKVSMVANGGDFFERMVELPNPEAHAVFEWARGAFHKSYKINPKCIWVFLAGTSSHDWSQPKHFLNVAPEGMDIRYIDTLCIETFEALDGMTIMYVPDNMGAMTPDEIWDLALKVLGESGLTKVDMVHFHGAFEFQLPSKLKHKCHILERWESITRYGIFAGHIHTPAQRGKLYTSGSFDRTRHGEEHPKGGYIIDINLQTKEFNPVFYENKNALPYLTMTVNESITPEQLLDDLHAFIKKRRLPNHSQIRVVGGSANVVNPMLKMIANDYPFFGFKAENEASKDEIVDEALFDTQRYQGVSLTKENLAASVIPVVKETLVKKGMRPEEIEMMVADMTKILKEFEL